MNPLSFTLGKREERNEGGLPRAVDSGGCNPRRHHVCLDESFGSGKGKRATWARFAITKLDSAKMPSGR